LKHLPPSPLEYAERLLSIVEEYPKLLRAFTTAFDAKNFDNMNKYSAQIMTVLNSVYSLYWFDKRLVPFDVEYQKDWRMDPAIRLCLSKIYKKKAELAEAEKSYNIEKYIKTSRRILPVYRSLLSNTMNVLFKKTSGVGIANTPIVFELEGTDDKSRMENLKQRANVFLNRAFKDKLADLTLKQILAEFLTRIRQDQLYDQ
jgi:hypothetical protein